MIFTINLIVIIILMGLIKYFEINTIILILLSICLVILEELVSHLIDDDYFFLCISEGMFLTKLIFYGLLISTIICNSF